MLLKIYIDIKEACELVGNISERTMKQHFVNIRKLSDSPYVKRAVNRNDFYDYFAIKGSLKKNMKKSKDEENESTI